MGKKAAFSDEHQALIHLEWPRLGVTMNDFSRITGFSEKAIRRYVAEHGLGVRPSALDIWPEAKATRIIDLYRSGVGVAEIARREGMTSNMVSSKLNRMNVLVRRGTAPPSQRIRAPKPKAAPRPTGVAAPRIRSAKPRLIIAGNGAVIEKPEGKPARAPELKRDAWEALPGVTPVRFIDAKHNHCRWPIGDFDGAEMMCCGAIATEGSYCATHKRRSVSANQPKKKTAQPVDYSVLAMSRRAA